MPGLDGPTHGLSCTGDTSGLAVILDAEKTAASAGWGSESNKPAANSPAPLTSAKTGFILPSKFRGPHLGGRLRLQIVSEKARRERRRSPLPMHPRHCSPRSSLRQFAREHASAAGRSAPTMGGHLFYDQPAQLWSRSRVA